MAVRYEPPQEDQKDDKELEQLANLVLIIIRFTIEAWKSPDQWKADVAQAKARSDIKELLNKEPE